MLNAVGLEEAPDISLQQNNYQNAQNDIGALSIPGVPAKAQRRDCDQGLFLCGGG